jgi:predicted RNA methylase
VEAEAVAVADAGAGTAEAEAGITDAAAAMVATAAVVTKTTPAIQNQERKTVAMQVAAVCFMRDFKPNRRLTFSNPPICCVDSNWLLLF